MAVIETWLRCDLKQTVRIVQLNGTLFSGDSCGNLIGVDVFDNGIPAVLSGDVFAKAIRADGTQVTISSGTLSGNKASVILTSDCYAVPGKITVTIKLAASSGTVTTLACATGTVYWLGGDS